MLELLLADDRTTCARLFFSPSNQAYDVALRNVKRRRNARFRGLVRFVLLLEPMRLQAATKVYAPGGAGFAAAAASFRAAAVHSKGPVSRPACASSTATPATPAMPGRRRQGRRLQGRRRQGKRRQRRQRSQGRRRQRRRRQRRRGRRQRRQRSQGRRRQRRRLQSAKGAFVRKPPAAASAAEPEWRTRHKHWRGTPGGETALAAGPARRPCAQGAWRRSGFGAKKSSVVAVFVFVFIFVFIFLVHVRNGCSSIGRRGLRALEPSP